MIEQNNQLETDITNLQEQIILKEQAIQNNLTTKTLIEQLEREKTELEAKLAIKEKELKELKKLILQQLINQKQQELENLKSDIRKGINCHLVDMICQLQREIIELENQLTNFFNDQSISSQKLSTSNVQWDQIIAELKTRQQLTEQQLQILQPLGIPGSSKNN